MPHYRKKPVVIEAFQLTEVTRFDNSEWPQWMHSAWNKDRKDEGAVYPFQDKSFGNGLQVHTKEGVMYASICDYIIQGVNGELYPCKPDIFEKTYELVNE